MASYTWTPSSRQSAVAHDIYDFINLEPDLRDALYERRALLDTPEKVEWAIASWRNYMRHHAIPYAPREAVIGDIYDGRAF